MKASLLDVNTLVALAWDSHVHHAPARTWFVERGSQAWATCPVTESGFVRVSSNPVVLPSPVGVTTARQVLAALVAVGSHRFLVDNVSMRDEDLPSMVGHRQVTDAHLLTVARRNGARVATFDRGLRALADAGDVELLAAL